VDRLINARAGLVAACLDHRPGVSKEWPAWGRYPIAGGCCIAVERCALPDNFSGNCLCLASVDQEDRPWPACIVAAEA